MAVDLLAYVDDVIGKPGKDREATDICIAVNRYPSLVGKWLGTELLMGSSELNEFVTDVRFEWTQDGRLTALPFTEDLKIRLYSNPFVFFIGYQNSKGFGIVPYSDWRAHLVQYNIPRSVITKVQNYLDNRKPASYW